MPTPRRPAVLTAGAALLALVGCSGSTPSAAPPSTSPSAAPALSPLPQGSAGGVVLGGEDLGITRLGAPFGEAVAAVSTVLGEPDTDPAPGPACPGTEREVRWGDLVLAAQDGLLVGWASRSPTLQTPSGVTVGTALAEVERLYGTSLERTPGAFSVAGVDLRGELSSAQPDAAVTRLSTRVCAAR